MRGYLGWESVASSRFKTLGKVHISSLRGSRRLVKLDSYANRVHDWLEEEGRVGKKDGWGGRGTKPEPISKIEFIRKFHSVQRNLSWVGNFERIDRRCRLKGISFFDASKV